ncbi:MAG TPA: EamA family transporter RarD [Bacteroidales bacterium]|nr:EamA family transporter RarD [Bacteroidales bacterium]
MKTYGKGILYALGAYTLWGVFPLYWHLITKVSAVEILAHRIFWSAIFMFILAWYVYKIKLIPVLKNWKQMKYLLITGTLISANWGVYIWAVNNNHVVDASLGYYINPLINVVLGYLFLNERLNKLQRVALFMALVGVTYLTIDYGKFPVIALFLASTFAAYGLLRKKAKVDAVPALTIETALVAPLALVFLISTFITNKSTYTFSDFSTLILLLGAGPATAIPLLLFGKAAETVPLSILGFVQYLSPTLQLFIGLFICKEPFTSAHLICFSFIWFGLLLFSMSFSKKKEIIEDVIEI